MQTSIQYTDQRCLEVGCSTGLVRTLRTIPTARTTEYQRFQCSSQAVHIVATLLQYVHRIQDLDSTLQPLRGYIIHKHLNYLFVSGTRGDCGTLPASTYITIQLVGSFRNRRRARLRMHESGYIEPALDGNWGRRNRGYAKRVIHRLRWMDLSAIDIRSSC